MREVILIAGLPGSGKSVLGRTLAAEKRYALLDDASYVLKGAKLDSYLHTYLNEQGLVITDPYLCLTGAIESARAMLKQFFGSVEIKVIAFENNPAQCLENVRARNDGRKVSGLIEVLSRSWQPEKVKDCEVRAVYSSSCKT